MGEEMNQAMGDGGDGDYDEDDADVTRYSSKFLVNVLGARRVGSVNMC